MRWLVGNWRLKLLSIGLTLVLLGAIAFTQNPPTTATVDLHIAYSTPPSQLVLLNPPESVQVRVVGLENSVRTFQQTFSKGPGAKVSLAGAKEGTGQTFQADVTASANGVSVSPGTVPVQLDLETMGTARMPIQVRVSGVNSRAGISVVKDQTYATCGSDTVKCEVTVRAPASLLKGLQAYLSYNDPEPSQAGLERVPGLPIEFERYGKPIDFSKQQAFPDTISVSPNEATARVQTQGGTLQTTAPVFVRTTGSVACGYQVQSLSYSPSTVTIAGPTEAVTKLQSVELESVDVTGLTSGETVTRQLQLPSGVQVVSGTPSAVTVSVTVAQAFSCTPSTGAGGGGTPAPKPTPAPTPAPTATPTG